MKTITFIIIGFIFPLALLGQSAAHIHKAFSENQEEIKQLIGENTFEATEKMFSTWVQSDLMSAKEGKTDFIMKTDSVVDRIWEQEANDWMNDWKNDFLYNEDWQATVIYEREWNPEQDEWDLSGRMEVSYNDGGQITSLEFHSTEDDEWKALSPQARMEVTYDDSGLIDLLEIYEYVEGDWVKRVIQDYKFSAGEQLDEIKTFAYDEQEDDWYLAMKMQFTYDDAGRRILSETYVDTGGEFGEVLTQKVEYEYNADGQLVESIESALDYTEAALLPEYKIVYNYDEDGIPDHVLHYYWESENWILDYKVEYEYDHDVNLSDVAYPFRAFAMLFQWEIEADVDPEFQKLPVKYTEYDYVDGDYHADYQTEIYYSPIDDAVEDYRLSYLAGENGSIDGETEQIVEHGEDGSEVEAIPDEGYVFVEWSDGLETAKRQETNVTADLTVTATFSADDYTITATAGEGGSISPSGEVSVTHGEDQTFSIEADEGYMIGDVHVDEESVGVVESYTFEEVTGNHTIHATFAATHAVTFNVDIGPALEYHDQVEGFEDFDPEEHHIYITGGLLGWAEPGTDPDQVMEVTDDENVYSATFHLAEGTYAYKYFSDVIDEGWGGGEWDGDPDREVVVEGNMTVENIFGWVDDPVAVEPVQENIELTLYPNPADTYLRIEANIIIEEVRMIDILGQVVYSSSVRNNSHEINVDGLKKGVYFLQVTTPGGITTERVQVTR